MLSGLGKNRSGASHFQLSQHVYRKIILSIHNFTNLSCNASSGTKRKTLTLLKHPHSVSLREESNSKWGFPQNSIGKQVSLVHSFQSAVAEGKRYVLKRKRSSGGQLLWLNEMTIFFPGNYEHDCWVYELLSFDVISCKNQFPMFTCDRWTVLSYVNIGKIHMYICMFTYCFVEL
jgi:hypothetical protein